MPKLQFRTYDHIATSEKTSQGESCMGLEWLLEVIEGCFCRITLIRFLVSLYLCTAVPIFSRRVAIFQPYSARTWSMKTQEEHARLCSTCSPVWSWPITFSIFAWLRLLVIFGKMKNKSWREVSRTSSYLLLINFILLGQSIYEYLPELLHLLATVQYMPISYR